MLVYLIMVENLDDARARYYGFLADQIRLEAKLAELDVQREDTRKQIESIRRIVAELATLCGVSHAGNLSALGITDACREVIRKAYPKHVSAKEIKERLEQGGFDLSQYQNPYAPSATTLARLEDSSFAEKKMEGFNVLYRWKRRLAAQSSSSESDSR